MKALSNLPERRKEELLGILMLTVGALLFLSLITHSAQDDLHLGGGLSFTLFEFTSDNWIGLIGAAISYMMYYVLGFLAFFVPIYAVISGVRYLFKWKLPKLRKKFWYSLLIISSLCLILSIKYVHSNSSIDFINTPGGALIVGLASFVTHLFGTVGAAVIFISSILVLTSLLIEWRPQWWDKKVATIPANIQRKIMAMFGVKTKTAQTARKSARTKSKSDFQFKSLLKPFTFVYHKIADVFTRPEIDEDEDEDYDRDEAIALPEESSKDSGRIVDLFEKLSSDSPVREIHTEKTDEVKEKEKLAVRMTRTPEDGYAMPDIGLLDDNPQLEKAVSAFELKQVSSQLLETLKTFNIEVVDDNIESYPGPIITRFEFKPAPGIKVNQVINLSDDLALALSAKRIRIIAPVPGKAAIGVEIPNRNPLTVYLKDILSDKAFSSSKAILPMALGLTTSGKPYVTDLASMPHLLIAGATGSGKSVCMNIIVTSMIYRHHPRNLRFIFIDPKMLELSVYSGIPHLERPVITKPQNAERALNDTVVEMENRYKKLAKSGVRNIVQYNMKMKPEERLPYIVVMVDELADLMMSQQASRIEILLTRLAQMARAVGIHLILATQRPSVDVITGLIKANFSARLAFQVATRIDSRTILDGNGAEKLLGKGDMLFLAPGQAEPIRVHGALITSEETTRLVDKIKTQEVEVKKIETMTEEAIQKRTLVSDSDPLYKEAVEVVIRHKQGSVSLLQRRLGIGYQRAARLIDMLESKGVVGPYDGSKARDVLVDQSFLEEINANS